MCDTLCALPTWTGGGPALFAKNSDRSPNEPHEVIYEPARIYAAGAMVGCTYIEIPQVAATRAVLLMKPSWTWGAEMAVNDRGVAVGNEAVFTRGSGRRKPGLTGLDLTRLAAERGASAREAAEWVIELLERHGQGGDCGYDHPFYYDNSFLFCDPSEAFILETSGREWMLVQVEGADAISNRLRLDREYDRVSPVVAERMRNPRYRWDQSESRRLITALSGSGHRLERTLSELTRMYGTADAAAMMAALRSHADGAEGLARGSARSVCMHYGGAIGDHTVGSCVAVLREGISTVWVTAASTPCIAAYKPVFLTDAVCPPVFESRHADRARAYWLQREAVHRAALAGRLDVAELRMERDALEAVWMARERELFAGRTPSPDACMALMQRASLEERGWIERAVGEMGEIPDLPGWNGFARRWNRKNHTLHEERK